MSSLLGPGLTHSVRLTGTNQATVSDLRRFLAELPADVPIDTAVDLHQEDPDRPGSGRSWSISASWRDVEEDR